MSNLIGFVRGVDLSGSDYSVSLPPLPPPYHHKPPQQPPKSDILVVPRQKPL